MWTKDWGHHVTHVIVDKGLTFQEVLKHLNLETFPVGNRVLNLVIATNRVQSTVMLLDESYPSECIKFRSILGSHHARFRILGMPVGPGSEETRPAGGASTSDSLPLKPTGKELQTAMTPEPDSPVRRTSNVSRSPTCCTGEVAREPPRTTSRRDVLDEMIEEARCARVLVG